MSKRLKQAGVVAAIVVAWQLAVMSGVWSEFVLPSPHSVYITFLAMLQNGTLIEHIIISTQRVFIGFVISFVIAFTLGMLAGLRPQATYYYDHLLEFLRHVPPLSLIPLLILWFGIGEPSRIIIIVLTMEL